MLRLGLLGAGEKGEVTGIKATHPSGDDPKDKDTCVRIENMGFRIGKTVEVLSNEAHNPLLVKVDEARIAISRGLAMKIMVRREG